MKKTVIAYVSGTRAEFGIVTPLLRNLQASSMYTLDLYATGMHLMSQYGGTLNLMEKEFGEVKKLEAKYKPERITGTAEFLAKLFPHLVTAFTHQRPDVVLVHGDRAEMLAVAVVCLYLHIPVIHTQGGDVSATDDNNARHAISKLSYLHFPATEEARQQLLSSGEPSDRIHVVGTLSLDTLTSIKILTKEEILKQLELPIKEDYLVVTQHPVSEELEFSGQHMRDILDAALTTTMPIIIIYPNADPGSASIIEVIEQYRQKSNCYVFRNIAYESFISLLAHCRAWIGNSSAGIVDSPYLHIPVINIGIRQKGREEAENILTVPPSKDAISAALQTVLYDDSFLAKVKACHNPWGDGTAVSKIMKVLDHTFRFEVK